MPPAAGKVYIFRGMGGRIASFEMDNLTEKLKRSGINSETYNHVNWRGPADEAIARYKSETRKSPIIVAGHSAGGDASIRFAERLKEANVPVSLIVSFDPTRFGGRVPPNVDRFINVWSSTNFFGGGNLVPDSSFHGHYASVDLRRYWNVLHVNLVRIDGLQDRVIAKMVQIMNLPVQLDGADRADPLCAAARHAARIVGFRRADPRRGRRHRPLDRARNTRCRSGRSPSSTTSASRRRCTPGQRSLSFRVISSRCRPRTCTVA